MNNLLILFAPKFKNFGCDIAKKYIENKNEEKCTIHGLCTGLEAVVDDVISELEDNIGYFWHLNSEEEKWLQINKYSSKHYDNFEKELGIGAFGRIITSDRRIGRGFVRGGKCRPDIYADKVTEISSDRAKNYVLGLYTFLDEVLKKTQANSVFCYAVAGAPALMLGMLCNARGISFSRLSPTRIGSRYVVDTDPMDRLVSVAKSFQDAKDGKLDISAYLPNAVKLLEEFRNKPEAPGYMIFNNSLLMKPKLIPKFYKAIKTTVALSLRILLRKMSSNIAIEQIRREWFNFNTEWQKKHIDWKCFSDLKSIPKEYVFYPLHVDPEASTMVLSPWHTDQINIIESLAKSAPINMTIVVKEHLPMLGLRPKGFYEAIARMPRVKLLSPFEDSLSLIKSASLVAVITGTAAWEAMRLGIPAIVFGNSPYLELNEGVKYEPNLSNLYKAIPDAIKMGKASDEKLELYIAAALYKSFDLNSSLLWGDYESHPIQERQFVVTNIVQGILDIEKLK